MSITEESTVEDHVDLKNDSSNSWGVITSYNLGEIVFQLLGRGITALYLFFYETELLLSGVLIIAANVVFSIWNAINDPLLGYLTQKPRKWKKKWGNYFPWILISGIPMVVFYVLVMAPPLNLPDWGYFVWMMVMLCLADTGYSIFAVNHRGLFPLKFRSKKDRRRVGVLIVVIGTFGTLLAFALPPMFYEFGDVRSYARMAVIIGVICIAMIIGMIPGIKPTETSKKLEDEIDPDQDFVSTLKEAFKQKKFVVLLMLFLAYNLWVNLIVSSLPYLTKYVLQVESDVQTVIWISYFGGTLLSIPLWNYVAKKKGFEFTFGIALFLIGAAIIPLGFVSKGIPLYIVYIIFAINGFCLAALSLAWLPVFSLVLDEVIEKTKKVNTGIYFGINTFVSRLEIILRTLIFIVVHWLTDFNPETVIQSDLALFGIKLHAAFIPAIFGIIGGFVFFKYYKKLK